MEIKCRDYFALWRSQSTFARNDKGNIVELLSLNTVQTQAEQ